MLGLYYIVYKLVMMKTISSAIGIHFAVILAATLSVFAVGMISGSFNSHALGQVNSTNQLKNTTTGNTTTSPAQSSNNQTTSSSTSMNNPQNNLNAVTGSISIRSTVNSALASKVKIPVTEAALTAQKAVSSNSSTTLAFLRALNGYLVYDLHVRDNNSNNTAYAVIVDAGNGQVLYKQILPPFLSSPIGNGYVP